MLSREKSLVKPMAPGSLFHYIELLFHLASFRSTIFQSLLSIYIIKIPKSLSYIHYLYQISLLQVAVKGLTTPLSRWLQGSWLFVQVLGDLCVVSYWIDTLVLKTEGNTYATLLHHPFLFKGKPTQCSRGSSYLVNYFCKWLIDKFLTSIYLFQNFWGSRSRVSYRLLQTILFLTDSVFIVLFTYFDESMASKKVYKP